MAGKAQTTGAPPPRRTRYQQGQQILDADAGPSTTSYQGYGKFWHLPLPEFLQVTLYGIRKIAPAPGERLGRPRSERRRRRSCRSPGRSPDDSRAVILWGIFRRFTSALV